MSELQYEFPEVRWKEYINNILSPVTEITYDDIISVSEPLYLKTLLRHLKHTDERYNLAKRLQLMLPIIVKNFFQNHCKFYVLAYFTKIGHLFTSTNLK